MRAIVMAGGRGTRMLPYTTVLPKPLLPVGERPVLAILLEQLAAAGATRIDVCIGYLGELIRAYLAETPPAIGDTQLAFHTESEPLGTAGALSEIASLDEPFLSLNGDVLTSLSFAALMDEHRASGAAITIAAQAQDTEISSGVLELSGDRVTAYIEKPTLTHLVSLGIYALAPRALEHLPPGRVDIPTLVDVLLAAGEDVRAHRFDGAWFDIGTIGEHEAAAKALADDPGRFLPVRTRQHAPLRG
ncbi:MAG TPA: sugar phosphate nucleotidyltransferase [Conexibacter sp.]|jgi:NDP-sugar pyrophosphorylase family protein|nr:sugar phosphate nucleotidyltransferase [Conexibacter sp.]